MIDFAFLDSGTGGIPYLLALKQKFPNANCIYVADTKNFPYGEKSHEEVVLCALNVCKKIIEKFEPKIIVIACNTISVNALDILREAFPKTKFVGTVPAIKVAGDISKKRCIGLLATKSTIEHPYNQDLKNHFASDCKMILHAAPSLISFIEKESFTASEKEIEDEINPTVEFFRKNNCDVIILGCTHFLNYKNVFQKLSNPDIKVVDSVEGVVNRAIDLFGGVMGDSPIRRGSEQAQAKLANASEGKAFPTLSTSKVFVTGFYDKKDEKEYDVICSRHKLSFGGIL